ncbi:LOW QUALITY PROTEIN: Reverse transcriptase [Phytophthora palmivora]|uniref:Reverse transcriptase n=1 Tax=Phytophthora palmivora TaxID=4796 RepID=A0A2P4WW35_9STRA|nr:LOW QUALITY PROTEIN: Reverse transcriptase [Phytophthora palmivora]
MLVVPLSEGRTGIYRCTAAGRGAFLTTPVAQRPRSVAPHLALKVYELLKKLLETGLIELSGSPWASPIMIVLKKNGVDVLTTVCFTKLSNYPLPLIDDRLIGFERSMWFMSLDMAGGFWAIRMTERAKLISAFMCPFGHFQWVRMPFGLKNAPLVYQAVINNCLWEEKLVDSDVLEFLNLDQTKRSTSGVDQEVPILMDHMTVFKRNIRAPPQMGPVLGRSSYIDDVAHGAPTWDQLCDDLNTLLYRLRNWNISVSLPKSEFGKLSIPYLSHEISAEGIRAIPKIAKSVQDLPFPSTLKGVQSFLGSLNYYHKFIEDFPVIAAVLYELTDEQIKTRRDLTQAKEAFEILKRKIVSTPLLRHPDRTRPFVIIPHANPWAACAVLGQEYPWSGSDSPAEIRYHAAEKEVVAVMRVFDVFEALIRDCPIKVYTKYSVSSWLLKSKSADERCVRWGLILSHWDLEVCKVQRDEDGLAAVLGAGITPREHLDEIAESLIPAKGRVKPPPVISVEMLEEDFKGYVLSFDGAAKTSTRQGSCGCIIWELPGWCIVSAQGFPLEDVTVNDAKDHGLLKGLTLVSERGISEIVVVGDSRIVIQQAQGLINCNQPNLQRRLAEYAVLKGKFKSIQLVHVKRDYNQAADYLTSKTLAIGRAWTVSDPTELMHLEQVSMIPERIMKPVEIPRKKATEALVEEPPAEVMMDTHPGADSAPLPAPVRVMATITRS